jgi:moderate conductance mechanosensitive channel
VLPAVLPPPSCVNDTASWCPAIYDLTGNAWLAGYADLLIATPLHIALIIGVALVLRRVAHSTINRFTRGDGRPPKILRVLRERRGDLTGLSERGAQRARTIGSVLRSLASFLLFGMAAMYVCQALGINLAPLLASAGVAGVAVAFGAQNLVRDFLSGMFMLVEDQYGVGDVVDVGKASGTVESVGLRITTLRDGNGTVWYVPNGTISRVGNSSQGFAVAVVDFPIGYASDLQRAIEVAATVATKATERAPLSEHVLEPPEMLGVNQITADTITLRLTVKVRPGKQWTVQRSLRAEIKRAFDIEDIPPPSPSGPSVLPAAAAES